MTLDHEPRDDLELHDWVEEAFDLDVPAVAPTPGQQSPFQLLSDLFFGRTRRALAMGARGSSKSTALALANLLISKFRPGTKTLALATVERQSMVSHDYLREFASHPELRDDIEVSLQDRVVWNHGSEVRVSSAATDFAVTGFRAHRLHGDELDQWEGGRFQNAMLAIAGDDEHPLQIVAASTRYSALGLLTHLLAEGLFDLYRWDLWVSLQQCQSCNGPDCPLFTWVNDKGQEELLCKGRGLKARGFTPLASVIDLYGVTSRSVWIVQQMLAEPGVKGKLFKNFSPERHVGQPGDIGRAPLAGGIDWAGGGHAATLVLLAKMGDVFWQIEEHGGSGVLPADLRYIALDIAERYNREPGSIPYYCGAHDALFKPSAQDWAAYGLFVVPCSVHSRSIRHGIIREFMDVHMDIGAPRLMFSENCPRTIRQIATARVEDEQAGSRRTNDDWRDAIGYVCAALRAADFQIWAGGGFVA